MDKDDQKDRQKRVKPKPASPDKKAALAQALRENLHRRKAQARARSDKSKT